MQINGIELNHSIQWAQDNPDADVTTYALKHVDYYKGFYEFGAKVDNPVLKTGEIFKNGSGEKFLIIGAGKPFWCQGITEEEAHKRIRENHYDKELEDMYQKRDSQFDLSFGAIDPEKIVYFDISNETTDKLGIQDLTSMAIRMLSETDIKFWQNYIFKASRYSNRFIYKLKYPNVDTKSTVFLLWFIDQAVKEKETTFIN